MKASTESIYKLLRYKNYGYFFEQQKIVAQIEAIENQIALLEMELENIPKQKEAVLKQYL
jgi:hypothetical protein